MRKVSVFDVISKNLQNSRIIGMLKDQHKNSDGFDISFKYPTEEQIDVNRHLFPLRTYKYNAWFHEWCCEGDHDDFGAIAIIERDDGSVETVQANCVQFTDSGACESD